MMSKLCSDVVESRVEQAILDAESRRNAAFTSDPEQPRRANPSGGARTSDNVSLCRADLSIDKFGDVSSDPVDCSGGRVGRGIQELGDSSPRAPTLLIRAQRSTEFTRLSTCNKAKRRLPQYCRK